MEERRTAKRVTPTEDCIVVHAKEIGIIKNISTRGLCCSCIQEQSCGRNIQKEIDILCHNGNFMVKNLKVRIIDSEDVAGHFLSHFSMKKCRMEFLDLREEQTNSIETIINGAYIH